ncbi:MAG: hypothetical protein LOY58_02885 [Gammaproteobacteria bacterium]|nr:hypothetical protein [Gammaproteobacteria bacterium]
MPSTTLQHRSSPAPRGNSQPLAPSAFSGETRLRELEHLAETARRVRDQAAAELARQGSAHHIARDRIAAAERMLRKAEKEIAELRAELEAAPSPAPSPEPATSVQDFELAVLLGHSKARLNRAGQASSSFQLEQDKPASPRVRTAARTDSRTVRPATARRGAAPATRGHGLALGLLATLGVGLVIFGVYVLNGADAAPQAVRQTIGTLIPGLAGEHGTDKAAEPVQAATAR